MFLIHFVDTVLCRTGFSGENIENKVTETSLCFHIADRGMVKKEM